jgi:hypothetical protein
MSPHQRALSRDASAVRSRRIRSARTAATGSAIVVFLHLAARPASQVERISRATRLRPCRRPEWYSTAATANVRNAQIAQRKPTCQPLVTIPVRLAYGL